VRRQRGLTIHALAEAAGVNPAQACVLDNGARVKSKLSIYLGMTPAELFPEGPEEPQT
jgi:hypothetical protein